MELADLADGFALQIFRRIDLCRISLRENFRQHLPMELGSLT